MSVDLSPILMTISLRLLEALLSPAEAQNKKEKARIRNASLIYLQAGPEAGGQLLSTS